MRKRKILMAGFLAIALVLPVHRYFDHGVLFELKDMFNLKSHEFLMEISLCMSAACHFL